MKRVIKLLLAAGSALIVLMLVLAWNFNRPPVDLQALKSLPRGTEAEQVKKAFGPPQKLYDGGREWTYSKPLGWSIVRIYFDENGRYARYEYDY